MRHGLVLDLSPLDLKFVHRTSMPEPNSALKLHSLSDLNGRGDAVLTLIRADNQKYVVTMTEADLSFWQARLEAVMTKAEETDAKLAKR